MKKPFWINDMHPRMVAHPIKPELDGKDLSDNKDPNGKKLFIAFVDEVKKSGSGYVDYLWPKPGSTEPVAKLSYVAGFDAWGWIAGSGVYVNEVRTAAAKFAVLSFAIGALVSIGVFGFVLWFSRGMRVRLAQAERALQALAEGDLTGRTEIDRLFANTPDETFTQDEKSFTNQFVAQQFNLPRNLTILAAGTRSTGGGALPPA